MVQWLVLVHAAGILRVPQNERSFFIILAPDSFSGMNYSVEFGAFGLDSVE
jgi:hypothetical protein